MLIATAGVALRNGKWAPIPSILIYHGRRGHRRRENDQARKSDWQWWQNRAWNTLYPIDQDHDGLKDLVIADQGHPDAEVSILYGESDGRCFDTSSVETLSLGVASGYYSLFSDVTGDSIPELLVNAYGEDKLKIYAGWRGQRLRDQFGSGHDSIPLAGKGWWLRPWAEIWEPFKLHDGWSAVSYEIYDLGDVNLDGFNDVWLNPWPWLACYSAGQYMDSLIDGIYRLPYSSLRTARSLGDIDGSGVSTIAVACDALPPSLKNPLSGLVVYMKPDVTVPWRGYGDRLLPQQPPVRVELFDHKGASDLTVRAIPNRANGQIRVDWLAHVDDEIELTIYNNRAEALLTQREPAGKGETTIDCRELPKGNCFLVARQGKSVRVIPVQLY